MIASLAYLAITQQSLSRPITFTAPGAPLQELLPRLSQSAAVELSPDERTGKDVLLIDIKNRPLNAVMDRIAAVTNATWKFKDGGYVLERTPEQEAVETAKDQEARAALLREVVQEQSQALSTPYAAEDLKKLAQDIRAVELSRAENRIQVWSQLNKARERMDPVRRALTRTMASFNAQQLAAIPIHDTVPFASYTGRVVRPLPGSWRTTLNQFWNEEKPFQAIVDQTEQPEREQFLRTFYRLQERVVPPQGQAHVLFEVSRFSRSHFQFWLHIISEQGNPVITSGSDILVAPKVTPVLHEGWKNRTHQWSERMRKLAASISSNESRPLLPFSQIDPLKAHPAALFSEEFVRALARTASHDVVAHLSDDLAFRNIETLYRTAAFQLDEAAKDIQNSTVLELRDGLLTLEPRFPSESRADRVDPRRLSSFLHDLTTSEPTLDMVADYALTRMEAETQGLDYHLLRAVGRSWSECAPVYPLVSKDFGLVDILLLHHVLPTATKHELEQGRSVQIKNPVGKYKQLLETALLGRAGGRVMIDMRLEKERKTMEPGWHYPNGIPNNVPLVITTESAVTLEAPKDAHEMTPASIGMYAARYELGRIQGFEGVGDPRGKQWRIVRRVSYKFSLGPEGRGASHELYEKRSDPSGKSYRWDQLPGDLGDQVKKAYDAHIKALGGLQGAR